MNRIDRAGFAIVFLAGSCGAGKAQVDAASTDDHVDGGDTSLADVAGGGDTSLPDVAGGVDTSLPDVAGGGDTSVADGERLDVLYPECVNSQTRLMTALPAVISSGVVMVADDATLYVGAFRSTMSPNQVIWAVSKSTGALRELWTGTEIEGVGGLALAGEILYFTTASSVRRMPKAGGAVETLASGQNIANALAVDATHAYWASSGLAPAYAGRVSRVNRNGGSPQVLADVVRASGIALDAAHVYTATGGGLIELPLGGGSIRTVAPVGGMQLAASATDLFVLSNYQLARVDKQTGVATVVFERNVGGSSVAVDDTHVYWTYDGYLGPVPQPGAGKVLKAPLAGGSITEIAICLPKPTAVTVDAAHVYWVHWATAEIMVGPK